MSQRLFDGTVRFEKVRGVGTMQVDFVPNQRAYVLIGENGIGKTKFLESLFEVLLLTCSLIKPQKGRGYSHDLLIFNNFTANNISLEFDQGIYPYDIQEKIKQHLPIVYLAAQGRGSIDGAVGSVGKIGSFQERNKKYIDSLFYALNNGDGKIKKLNMDVNITEWIIQRAQSSNPYQSKEDNRKVELDILLFLLNKIDSRIDKEFLEISGDNRIFIKIENNKTELSHLSSGFTSILKIIQTIVSGYSYFTNEVQIENVRGVVLIDEIESHLHNDWQVKIIPLLKALFPNTTFFITTHSSLVISQLEQGEVYRLQRGEDGVVYGKLVDHPSNASLVDLLDEAFGVDLNQQKIERAAAREQKEARQALLQLVQQELNRIEAES